MCHVPSSLVAAAEDVDEGGARFVEDGAQANGNSAGVAGSSTSRRVRAYVDFHATDPYNNGNGGRPTRPNNGCCLPPVTPCPIGPISLIDRSTLKFLLTDPFD